MTESEASLSSVGNLPELLWFIAEHDIDTIDAVPVPPLLQQALDDGLVHWPSPDEEKFCLALTAEGRHRVGLPPLAASGKDEEDLLRAMGRRSFWRFILGPL
jgi:hypothetical protein